MNPVFCELTTIDDNGHDHHKVSLNLMAIASFERAKVYVRGPDGKLLQEQRVVTQILTIGGASSDFCWMVAETYEEITELLHRAGISAVRQTVGDPADKSQ